MRKLYTEGGTVGKTPDWKEEVDAKALRLAAAVLEGLSNVTIAKAHEALVAHLRKIGTAGSERYYSELGWRYAIFAAAERGTKTRRANRRQQKDTLPAPRSMAVVPPVAKAKEGKA